MKVMEECIKELHEIINEQKTRISELEADVTVKQSLIAELNERHMDDSITINQLQTTIDTLVDRYAKLREMKGL